jgi:hypothetical protein
VQLKRELKISMERNFLGVFQGIYIRACLATIQMLDVNVRIWTSA